VSIDLHAALGDEHGNRRRPDADIEGSANRADTDAACIDDERPRRIFRDRESRFNSTPCSPNTNRLEEGVTSTAS
jgi:hypothetical protein